MPNCTVLHHRDGDFFSLTTAGDNNMPLSMKESGTLYIGQTLAVFYLCVCFLFLEGWRKFLVKKISIYMNDNMLQLAKSVDLGWNTELTGLDHYYGEWSGKGRTWQHCRSGYWTNHVY